MIAFKFKTRQIATTCHVRRDLLVGRYSVFAGLPSKRLAILITGSGSRSYVTGNTTDLSPTQRLLGSRDTVSTTVATYLHLHLSTVVVLNLEAKRVGFYA